MVVRHVVRRASVEWLVVSDDHARRLGDVVFRCEGPDVGELVRRGAGRLCTPAAVVEKQQAATVVQDGVSLADTERRPACASSRKSATVTRRATEDITSIFAPRRSDRPEPAPLGSPLPTRCRSGRRLSSKATAMGRMAAYGGDAIHGAYVGLPCGDTARLLSVLIEAVPRPRKRNRAYAAKLGDTDLAGERVIRCDTYDYDAAFPDAHVGLDNRERVVRHSLIHGDSRR